MGLALSTRHVGVPAERIGELDHLAVAHDHWGTASTRPDRLAAFRSRSPETEIIHIVLFDGYRNSEVSLVTDAMRMANRISGHELYRWDLLGFDTQIVTSDTGFETLVKDLRSVRLSGRVMVPGAQSLCKSNFTQTRTLTLVQGYADQLYVFSEAVVAMCNARIILDGPATVPTRYESMIRERFPDIDVRDFLYTKNGKTVCCRGGVSVLDLFLDIISQTHGSELSNEVADAFAVGRIRAGDERVLSVLQRRAKGHSPRLQRAVEIMEKNIEEPISQCVIAEMIGLSNRQLQRIFKRAFGKSPAVTYKEIRLAYGHELLVETGISVTEAAFASGYVTCSHFSQAYKRMFGSSPSDTRSCSTS